MVSLFTDMVGVGFTVTVAVLPDKLELLVLKLQEELKYYQKDEANPEI